MDYQTGNRTLYPPGHPAHRQGGSRAYNDSSDRFWAMYLADAEKYDVAMTESMKGDTDGMLIFTGLFAATVAAFIIEFYKKLNPDSGDDTVTLLSGIAQQVASVSNGSTQALAAPPGPFHTPAYAVRLNSLWFISLFLSLAVALSSTLVQQWSRRYLHAARRRGPPHKRGPMHSILLSGMKQFRIEQTVEVMIGLLHISVFLFLIGLVDLLFVINPTVAHTVLPFVIAGGVVYLVLTLLPLVYVSSPYDTPITQIIRIMFACFKFLLWVFLLAMRKFSRAVFSWHPLLINLISWQNRRWLSDYQKWLSSHLYQSRKNVLEDMVESRESGECEKYALHLTLKLLDEDWEVEEFLACLPGLLKSLPTTIYAPSIMAYLICHQDLIPRIQNLLHACLERQPLVPANIVSRRLSVIGDAFSLVHHHVMQSPECIAILNATNSWDSTIFAIQNTIVDMVGRLNNYYRGRISRPRLLAVSAALAQLRDHAMRTLLCRPAQRYIEEPSPLHASRIVMVLADAGCRPFSRDMNLPQVYHTLQWTPINRVPLPYHAAEEMHLQLIQRAGILCNINTFVRETWEILTKPDRMSNDPHFELEPELASQEDYDVIVDTLHILVDTLNLYYKLDTDMLWLDAVDEFAMIWEELVQKKVYLTETHPHNKDEEDPFKNVRLAEFFSGLRYIARKILPHSTAAFASRELRCPLPKPTPSEIEFFASAATTTIRLTAGIEDQQQPALDKLTQDGEEGVANDGKKDAELESRKVGVVVIPRDSEDVMIEALERSMDLCSG